MDTRWTKRAADATIEAIAAGADPDQVRAAVEAAIAEGQRIRNLRTGHTVETRPTRRTATPAPGSAIAALLAATS